MDVKTNAAPEAIDRIKGGYSAAVKGAQDYNNKLLEFAQTNTNTTFEFAQRLMGVKSPAEFIALSTERARQQFATLAEQTSELAALAQRVTFATTGPLAADVTKAFGRTA